MLGRGLFKVDDEERGSRQVGCAEGVIHVFALIVFVDSLCESSFHGAFMFGQQTQSVVFVVSLI